VLDVREPELRGVGLVDAQVDGLPGGERELDRLGIGVDVADQRGGAVTQRSVIRVVDSATDLDLVAGVEAVRAAGRWDRVGAELGVLVADRLVARVQLVEVVVRGLGEHDRRAPVLGVSVGGVECGVFGAGEVSAGVDARAGGVPADRELVVAVAEAGLIAAVAGVVGAEVAGQNSLAVLVAGGCFEVRPESAGTDRRVLVWVADSDQPCAGGLDCGEEGVLFAGGGECGFVVDDCRLRPEEDRAVGDRGLASTRRR